ncbi:serine/threonine protein kinase [Bifidobacterium sp. 82T24]|uniref:serine/threonine protein kinase n=1 Tax=Bifidobacterium pluvialisilvae TaxID=2834436 RepID=UPI001C561A2B|nr:serine/threonine-protein kinase [Bifidobacterium pluvialisilvae]MBW3088434.1 serine/threonine protein kinase [Bifidobacterium pluvialisilvae]
MDDKQVLHAMNLDDAYHVERVLARGAYGVTELVSIDGTGPFVRKKIPLDLARRRLWSAIAECRSPRLPRIEAMYELPDCFVVVYDFVDGWPLDQIIASQGRLPASDATRIAMQVCEAAQELHGHGIVHRDITPGNIIMADDGAHLIDFGIARETDGPAKTDRNTTALGTWGFAAPEQYGFAAVDARSDVYAIGRLLGYMLTGVYPADKQYDAALADETVVPAELRAVVDRACAFEPSARFGRAAEFRHALEYGLPGDDAAGETDVAGDGVVADGGRAASGGDGVVGARNRGRGRGRLGVLVAAIVSAVVVALVVVIGGVALLHGRMDGMGESAGPGSSGGGTSGLRPTASTTSSSPTSGDRSDAVDNPLAITEHGWSSSNGFVHYAVAIRNADKTRTIVFPELVITGRSADGKVVFSDTQTLPLIYPGETLHYGGQGGDGVAPETVEFSLNGIESMNVIDTGGVETFAVSGVNETRSGDGGVTFGGEVTTTRDDDNGEGIYGDNGVNVTVILRDAQGRIVYGEHDYVDKPAKGKSKPFSITIYGLPRYATVEAYAATA